MANIFRDIKIDLSTTSTGYILPVPCICPHCGVVMVPAEIVRTSVTRPKTYYIFVLRTNCCDNHFLALYTHDNGTRRFTYLAHYPNQVPLVLPDSLSFSQRFVDLYAQAHTAELNGHIELAGSGYRNALEVLVKDYAIKYLQESESEVSQMFLGSAIEKYMPGVSLKNSADIVRLLGNDCTHYQRKYTELGFEVLKRYMQIFINYVDAEIVSREPPINLPRNLTAPPTE